MNTSIKTLFKRSPLHPVSIKTLRKGHPWITKDEYSSKFFKEAAFIIGTDNKQQDVALLINDPSHPQIKARLWSTKIPCADEFYNFKHELDKRIGEAIKKRPLEEYLNERDNVYLVFGEADFIPALLILLIKDHILIQSYSSFWDKYKGEIIKSVGKHLPDIHIKTFTYQKRNQEQKKASGAFDKTFVINEYGVNYQIRLDHYDIGIYTDMSPVRKMLIPYFKTSRSMLNLFSFTGSFSLLGLKSNIKEVISVDISTPYNEWLNKNLELNSALDHQDHQLIKAPVEQAVGEFIKNKKTFDLIICDPPSFSSSKNKSQNSFKGYEELLPNLIKLTSNQGHIVIFINTHKINKNKFEKKIKEILQQHQLQNKIIVEKKLGLMEDCHVIKPFPEGDYLKGLILKKQGL